MVAPTTPGRNRENQPKNDYHSWLSSILTAENKKQNLTSTPPHSGAFAI